MDDSGAFDEPKGRRQVFDEDDDSESGDNYNRMHEEGGSGQGGRNANLTGTGLSSDSEEDDDVGEAESGAVPGAQGGFAGGRGGVQEQGAAGADSADEDDEPNGNVDGSAKPSNSAMRDLFGDEDDDDDDDDDDEPEASAVEGGDSVAPAPSGGSGRYGDVPEDDEEQGAAGRGGESSDDEDVFGEGGGIRSSSGKGIPAASYSRGDDDDRGPLALSRGSDDEEELELARQRERERQEEEARRPVLPDRELQIPSLPRPPLGADVIVSRLPNILGVKTEAFDPDTYVEEAEADEFKFTTNIIRWRHKRDNRGRLELGEDGRPLLETNTRLVKWSDGSMQLLVGDEAFDVGENSMDRSALFVQQMTQEGSVLQCQGELNKKISFRPCNVLSKAHRKLTLEVRRRAHRDSRLQRFAETTDPEQAKQERARAQAAMIKHKRRTMKDHDKWVPSHGGRRMNMDISYLEEPAYVGPSVKDIKRDSRAGRYDRADGLSGDEDDGEDEDTGRGMAAFRANRAATAAAVEAAEASKRGSRSGKRSSLGSDDSEEEAEEDEDDEDDEDDRGARRKHKARADADERAGEQRRVLGDDSEEDGDDDDDGEGPTRGKRRRAELDDEEDEDYSAARPSGSKRVQRAIADDSESE